MTHRLPVPGLDAGTWGYILNDFLQQAHNSDGTLSSSAVSAAGAEQTSNKGQASGYAGLDGSSKLNIANIPTGTTSTTVAIGSDSRITGAVQASIATTKGDLFAATAASTITRLGVGTDTQILTADSTQASGMKWSALPASLPPSGTASGDLSGTYPAPTVAKVNGVTLPSTPPTSNQVLTATSPSTTAWSTPAAGVQLDTTATDIQPLGTQAAGSIGKAADAGHVHALPRLDQVGNPITSVSLNSQKLTNLANGTVASDAAAFGQLPPTVPLKSTWWYPMDGGGGSRTMAYALLWVFPFDCQKQMTMTSIGCNVKTAGTAGSTIRLGVFLSDGAGFVGNVLLDAGTVAGDSTGVKSVSISQAVSPGRVWFGAVWQGTSTTAPILQAYARAAPYVGWSSFYQFPSIVGYQYNTVSGALTSLTGVTPNVENSSTPAVQFQVQ